MENNPRVSVVIPTHNRSQLLKKALKSVLGQTYQNFEIIVVDDGMKERAGDSVGFFNDSRIRYIAHGSEKGGSAARNTGVVNSEGAFIAFLDDDDEWLPEKLKVQMDQFENTPNNVGFCFSAVVNIFDKKEIITTVPGGIKNYHELALESFKKFLTVTLIVKRRVFVKIGFFDEDLPSHQEAELMIRITKMFDGVGINQPLVRVNMTAGIVGLFSSGLRRIQTGYIQTYLLFAFLGLILIIFVKLIGG